MGYSTENLFTQVSYQFRTRIENQKITNMKENECRQRNLRISISFEFHILTVRRTHPITIANAVRNVCLCIERCVFVLSYCEAYCFEWESENLIIR